MKRLTNEDRNLIAFAVTLLAILFLVKVGGGTNIAIITPLLTLLGAIGQNFRRSVQPPQEPQS